MQHVVDAVLDKATGRPLQGVSVYIYTVGTTTPVTIYSDDGVTPVAQPLTTNANGVFDFWVAGGRYDFKFTGSGITDQTYSNVEVDAFALSTAGKIQASNGNGGFQAATASNVVSLFTGTPDGTKVLRDDGTLVAATGGTVTHTAGNLTANQVVIGNGTADLKTLGSLGTTTTVLHGNAAGAPSYSAVVEGDLSLSDVTTANVSTSAHGFAPKAPNNTTQFLRADATWATPTNTSSWTYNGSKKRWELFDSTITGWLQRAEPALNWSLNLQPAVLVDGTTTTQFYGGEGITAWQQSAAGTGSNAYSVDGGLTMTTGTTGGNANTYCGGALNTSCLNPSRIQTIHVVVKSGATVDANTMYRVGYANGSADPPTDGIYIEKKNADTQWFLVARSGGVESRSAAIATVSTSTVFSYVLVITASRVDVYIPGNASSQGNVTTNIPTANLSPFAMVKTNTTAARVLQLISWRGVVDLASY